MSWRPVENQNFLTILAYTLTPPFRVAIELQEVIPCHNRLFDKHIRPILDLYDDVVFVSLFSSWLILFNVKRAISQLYSLKEEVFKQRIVFVKRLHSDRHGSGS